MPLSQVVLSINRIVCVGSNQLEKGGYGTIRAPRLTVPFLGPLMRSPGNRRAHRGFIALGSNGPRRPLLLGEGKVLAQRYVLHTPSGA